MSKKNLAIIIPTLANGGAERVASILSLFLPGNYNQHIMLYDASKVDYQHKGELIDLSFEITSNPIKKFYLIIKRIIIFKKMKKRLKIDISISFLDSVNLLNLLSKKNEKIIVTVHSYKSKVIKGVRGKIIKTLMTLLYNKSDRIIAVSHMVKKDLIEEFNLKADKIDVIYNSVELRKIESKKEERLEKEYEKLFSDYDVIINVGRLTKAKGQEHLIKAFAEVRKKNENAKLVILGNGELEVNLKRLAENLGLNNDVYFLGYKSNAYKYISKSKVLVSSSLWEGFGNVIVEAMACGTPVISTDCKAGPREILAPTTDPLIQTTGIEYAEYGVLTPVPNKYVRSNTDFLVEESFLSKAILEILEDEIKRVNYINKGMERVVEFDIDNIIVKWEKLLNEI